MNREVVIEAVALYWPMAMCGILYILQRESNRNIKRTLTAALMASTWVAATLPWLNDISVSLGFWSFHIEHEYSLKNLPLSLYVGWIFLWGLMPALLLKFISPVRVIMLMVLLDLVTMPHFSPVMKLTSGEWLWGELLLVVISLVPAVLLAKWVSRDERVSWRAGVISAAFVMIILVVIPTSSETVRVDILGCWMGYSLVEKCFWLMLLLAVSIPGIAGVMEFSEVGNGTPIPYDPPKRLLTTGVYGYVQNPMQLSMVAVLLIWAWMLGSWFVVGLALVALIYSAGIARWSESVDLERRFGDRWVKYNEQVSAWKFRLSPVWIVPENGENARIYIDDDCAVCQPLAMWIKSKRLTSLDVHASSEWEGDALRRITYQNPNTGEIRNGVQAMARVFQHIHLGWAWLGWVVSLPGLSWLVQSAFDASGGGKQNIK